MSIRKLIIKKIIKNNFKLLTTLDIGAALSPTFEFSLLSKNSIRVDGRKDSIELTSKDSELISFISDKEKEIFYELKKSTCSSLLKPNYDLLDKYPKSERFKIVKEIQVNTKKLSDIIRENPDLKAVKIDVQGAELKVLQSAEDHIKQIEFFEIETSFRPMYENGSSFADVYNYMLSNNFYLLDLRKQYWSNSKFSVSGDLIWCDCLFIRKDMSPEVNDIMSLVYGYLHRINDKKKNTSLEMTILFRLLKIVILFNNIFNKIYLFNSPLSNCSEKKLGF